MESSVKVAKLENQRHALDCLVKLLNNPVFSLLILFIVVETLQKVKLNNQPLMGEDMGTLLEGALLTKEALSALSKSEVLDDIKSLIPLLVAK